MSGGASRQLTDAEGNPVSLDISGNLVFIDTVHWRIHEGQMFSADVFDPALANAAFLQVLVQVPSGLFAHVKSSFNSGGDALGHLYENTTFSAAGSVVTGFNRNRASSKIHTITITEAPTITSKGDPLPRIFIPGGGGLPFASGGGADFFNEFILPEGIYLVELENISGSPSTASIQIDWYEPI